MNNLYRAKGVFCLYVVLPLCVLLIASSLCGCEPLRKKFTRKKDEDRKNEIIPLFNPIDYPAKMYSHQEIYRHRYSLWEVWHKELMTALQENEGDKSILYNLDELLVQLQEMQKVAGAEVAAGLDLIGKDLLKIYAEFQKPAGMRNTILIKNKLVRLDRQLRQKYSPDQVKDSLSPD